MKLSRTNMLENPKEQQGNNRGRQIVSAATVLVAGLAILPGCVHNQGRCGNEVGLVDKSGKSISRLGEWYAQVGDNLVLQRRKSDFDGSWEGCHAWAVAQIDGTSVTIASRTQNTTYDQFPYIHYLRVNHGQKIELHGFDITFEKIEPLGSVKVTVTKHKN